MDPLTCSCEKFSSFLLASIGWWGWWLKELKFYWLPHCPIRPVDTSVCNWMCKMGQSGPKTANKTTNLIGQEPLIFKHLLLTHLWSLQKMHWNTFLCVVNLSLFVPDTLEIEHSLKTNVWNILKMKLFPMQL